MARNYLLSQLIYTMVVSLMRCKNVTSMNLQRLDKNINSFLNSTIIKYKVYIKEIDLIHKKQKCSSRELFL